MGLRQLRIAGVAVIDRADCEVGPEFSVLTGETGAGKSVSVLALRFVLGGKMDTAMIRAGEEGARVSAVFDSVPETVISMLEGLGIEGDDILTLTRELPRGGRGVSRINGAVVSLGTLRDVGDALVEITAQGESHKLTRATWQRSVVDAVGGDALTAHRAVARDAIREWRNAEKAINDAQVALDHEAAEIERARQIVDDLGSVHLVQGEDEELHSEQLRLRHAVDIATVATTLRLAAGGSDDVPGAADLIARAVEEARPLSGVDAALAATIDEAEKTVERLRDLAVMARRCADGVSVNEGRLAEIEERLDVLARVRRRYGSIDAARADLHRAQEIVDAHEGGDKALERLVAVHTVAANRAASAVVALTEARAVAARALESSVEEQLGLLELPHARFRVVMNYVADPAGVTVNGAPVRCGEYGADEVDFRFLATRDGMPLPLGEGPSGGELSRLALALRVVASDIDDSPTLVLDEVDTGIGGETAARVGELLRALGHSRQVIAITHRPEIAARAHTHLYAKKETVGGGEQRPPTTSITPLVGMERVTEIARLMSGRATEAALARAGELLREGAEAALPVATPSTI